MSSTDLIRGFQTLGCQDELKCAVACLVYLDLMNDDKINNLEYDFDKDLQLIYFRLTRESPNSNIIIPVSSTNGMNVIEIAEIQHKFNGENKSITIAICDPSSTVLYYHMTNEFVEKNTLH